jgi:hypothetical protein
MSVATSTHSPNLPRISGRENCCCFVAGVYLGTKYDLSRNPRRFRLPMQKLLSVTAAILWVASTLPQGELCAFPFWWWDGGSSAQVVSTQPHPAVARISAEEQGAMSFGSGTLIATHPNYGLIITNWHVIRDCKGRIEATFPNGIRIPAVVVSTDPVWDLALLMIPPVNIGPVPISPTVAIPGENLIIAGYGRGNYRAAAARCVQYVAPGIGYPPEMLEVSVGARQGDSGGPIFNSRGQLAGVLFGTSGGRTFGSHSARILRFLATAEPQLTVAYGELARLQRPGVSPEPGTLASIPSGNTPGLSVAIAPAAFVEPAHPSPEMSPNTAASSGGYRGPSYSGNSASTPYDPLAATDTGSPARSADTSGRWGSSKDQGSTLPAARGPGYSPETDDTPAAQLAAHPQVGSPPAASPRNHPSDVRRSAVSDSVPGSGYHGGNSKSCPDSSPGFAGSTSASPSRSNPVRDVSSTGSAGASRSSSYSRFTGVTAETHPRYGSQPASFANSAEASQWGQYSPSGSPYSSSGSPSPQNSSMEGIEASSRPRGSYSGRDQGNLGRSSFEDYSFEEGSAAENHPPNYGYKSYEPSSKASGANQSSPWATEKSQGNPLRESSTGSTHRSQQSPGLSRSFETDSKTVSSFSAESTRDNSENSGSRFPSRSGDPNPWNTDYLAEDTVASPGGWGDSKTSSSFSASLGSPGSAFSQEEHSSLQMSDPNKPRTSISNAAGEEHPSRGTGESSITTASSLPTAALPSGQGQSLPQEDSLQEPIDLLSGLCYELFAILSVSGVTLLLLKLFAPRHRRRYYHYRRRRYSPAYGSSYWD